MSQENCPFCESLNLAVVVDENTHEIDGDPLMVAARSHVCEDCGAKFGNGSDMRFNARAMRAATKRVRKLLTGEEVRAIRERLRLTQQEAAALFGGGPVAFSKYESDDVAQSDAMNMLLRLVDLHPNLVDEMAHLQGVLIADESKSYSVAKRIFAAASASSKLAGQSFDTRVMGEASNMEMFYDSDAPDLEPVNRKQVAA